MRQAIGYCRVSTQGQADKDISIPAQMKEIAEYAKHNDIVIVEWFKDDVSAYHDVGREDFERAIKRASNNDLDFFLVHDSTRFCRDRYNSIHYKRILKQYGVSVVAITRPYDPSTETGVVMEALDEALAQTDSMRIAKHTMKGMKQNAQMRDPNTGYCFKNGGRAPYGYRNVSMSLGRDSRGKEIRKQLWEIDPDQAEIVRWIFRKRLEDWGYKAIASDLNCRNIKTSTGNQWSPSHIREMCYKDRLLSYAGTGIWNKTTDHYKARPESEWIIVPDAHPQIISEDWIDKISEQHLRRSTNPLPRVRESSFLLTGENISGDRLYKVECGDCQGYMTGINHSQKHSYYGCSERVYQRKNCDKKHRVPKKEIEQLVINDIVRNFSDPKTVRKWAEEAKTVMNEELFGIGEKQIALRREKTDLAKKQNNLYQAIENGLPFAQVKDRLNEMDRRLKEIEFAAASLLEETPEFDVQDILKRFSVLEDELARGGSKAKEFIKQLVVEIVYYPDTGKHDRTYRFIGGKGGVGRGTYTIPLIRIREENTVLCGQTNTLR